MKKFVFYFVVSLLGFYALSSFAHNSKNTRVVKKRATVKRAFRITSDVNPYKIIVYKSKYELQLFDEEGWYATYPIVFGSKDLGDKMREGDRRTPNGEFKIIMKKDKSKWGQELLLDYPSAESVRRFKERKAKGLIPKNARIGDGIAIHSTRKEEEWTVDNFYNWTDGCISVKYSEMQELYDFIPVGTPVSIVQ
jgi:murein L,D-transpeptidase YafK